MKLSKDRLDPDIYYRNAQILLETVNEAEALAWITSPCTKALLATLDGDLSGILLMWLEGAYSNEDSTDSTAQKQAKARGQAQAVSDIVEQIVSIGNLSIKGENDANTFGSHDPS